MNPGIGVAAGLLCVAGAARAQLPLSIEQLIVRPAKWQLSAAVDYATSQPAAGASQRLSRGRTALRYGLASGLELNAAVQVSTVLHRVPTQTYRSESHSLSAGVNWLLKPETALPAILLEARAELAPAYDGGGLVRVGEQLMLTTYRSIDPLVLSLTAMWDQQRSRVSGEGRLRPGSIWRLEPVVNFAVNPRVTLLGGLSLSRRRATLLNGRAVDGVAEMLALRGGVGVELTHRSRVFLNGNFTTGAAASSATLQWFYDF